jgi:intracellular sulfur oxidation DsrE/DsrF family protein
MSRTTLVGEAMFRNPRLAMLSGLLFLLVVLGAAHSSFAQQARQHRLVLHVDTEDAETMNLALNNAINVKKFYDAQGQAVTIEIVAYGPGITMLRSDTSPVKDRIKEARSSVPGLALSMCGNAKAGAEKREGREIIPLEGVRVVPAGIVRIMELEEQGYSYVRP